MPLKPRSRLARPATLAPRAKTAQPAPRAKAAEFPRPEAEWETYLQKTAERVQELIDRADDPVAALAQAEAILGAEGLTSAAVTDPKEAGRKLVTENFPLQARMQEMGLRSSPEKAKAALRVPSAEQWATDLTQGMSERA
jgi:hypothetical protein